MKDNTFFRGIRGPVGSGKSVACSIEIFRRALLQEPDKSGKRKSRWAIIRNTNPQLRTTTIKTWLDWFPEEDHWWSIMSGEVPVPDHITLEESRMLIKPDNWRFFTQPSGMIEEKDEDGVVSGYLPNDKAENTKNILESYYPNLVQGKTKSWIDVYVMNRLGSIQDGKPVYNMFVADTHVAKEEIPVADGVPLYIGLDFGLTPAAVFGQKVRGRWNILQEIVAFDMGVVRFAELLRAEIATRYANCEVYIYGDPAGDFRSQTDESTPFQILRGAGLTARPTQSNDVALRIESVASVLNRMVDGLSGILIDFRCKELVKGFEGGYQYRRLQVSGERYEDKPLKDRYSHIHDALQYLMLGSGEGRQVLGMNKKIETFNARVDYDVFSRRAKPQRRQGLWARM